jgi:hypothetical protein
MEFPPAWEVLPNDAFLGYDATTQGGDFGAALLVQMREDGTVVDHFRINIFGDTIIQAHFAVSRIIDIPEAKGVYAFFQCPPADAQPNLGRTATNFLDLQSALMEGYIILTDVGQQPIEAKEFRDKLCSEGTAQQAVGASLRWAVGVNPSRHTELVLQALPLPTKFLLPGHHVDNVATISIFSLSLPMVLADDSSFEGPIPQIFSNCPSDTLAALHNKPLQYTKAELHKAVKHFLFMEYITLREAKEYVRKLRPSLGRPAFHNAPAPAATPPAAKRSREDSDDPLPSGSGTAQTPGSGFTQ